MKIAVAVVAASLAFTVAPAALAQDAPAATSDQPAQPPQSRAQELDALFATLQSTKDEAAATKAENDIIALWLQSGSPTIDLLMTWGLEAIDSKDYASALDILDRVVTLKPDYAEGWNKRATVYYLTDKYSQSIADIRHVLVLEPRHFGALSGLGMIFSDLGEDKKAIDAYKQALAIDPHLDSVKNGLDMLENEARQGRISRGAPLRRCRDRRGRQRRCAACWSRPECRGARRR